MNKTIQRTLIITMSCIFLLSGTTLFINANKVQEIENIIQYKEEDTITTTNQQLLNKVKTLQTYAEEYISSTNSTSTATDLCMQFIRNGRYSSGLWTILLGSVDTNFVSYVTAKDSSLTFTADDILLDYDTGNEIDFIHMIAVLNSYYTYGAAASGFSTHYAGWAGDLMTLLEEVANYRINNSITDTTELSNYTNSLLGTNSSSSFSKEDALADIDAMTIYASSTLATDFYTTLYDYYIGHTNSNNSSNRYSVVQSLLGDSSTVQTTATTLLSNTFVQQYLIPTSYANVTSSDIAILSQEFAEYIYEKPYLKMTTHYGMTTVGLQLEIDLVYKHLKNATLEYDSNILSAEISSSKLIITPLQYGSTNIKITSRDKTVSDTYSISVINQSPSITEDLDQPGELIVGITKTLAIKAEGTNNVYTWYLSSTKDGEYTKLTETTEPKLDLEPKANMNNKYLKCGVKNNGNEEVFTTPILLKVTDTGIVNTSDTSLIIAGMILIFVLSANLLQILISKHLTQKEN